MTRRLPGGPIALLAIAVVLPGAGSARVSGDIEPDTAPDGTVLTERASPLPGGASEAGRTALAKADAYCRDRGRRLLPVGTADFGWPIQRLITGPTGATLTFRCAVPRAQQRNVGEPQDGMGEP